MKRFYYLYVIIISLVLLPSCNSEQDVESVENIDTDADYTAFIADLEKENEGYVIYHKYNMPDFSKEIEEILNLSKEVEINSDDFINTRSLGAKYGPWGGTGGSPFDAPITLGTGETWKRIIAIKIRHGAIVDGIQLYWVSNNSVHTNSPHFGGQSGAESWLYLNENEYITSLTIRHGNKVDNLSFKTNTGKIYTYGGTGGTALTLAFGTGGYQMQGIYGRSGNKLDQMGIYCYPNSMFP